MTSTGDDPAVSTAPDDPAPASRATSGAAAAADAALRTRIAAEAFQLRSRALRKAQDDVAAVRADLRALAADVGPRIQALEARLVVLSRTIGHMLAELDQTHATTVVALRRGATPPLGSPIVDGRAPTPRPD